MICFFFSVCKKHWKITAVAVDMPLLTSSTFHSVLFFFCLLIVVLIDWNLSACVLVNLPNHKFIIQFQNYGQNNKIYDRSIFFFQQEFAFDSINIFFLLQKCYRSIRIRIELEYVHSHWTKLIFIAIHFLQFNKHFLSSKYKRKKNFDRAQLTHI